MQPLQRWLAARGVFFQMDTRVTDLTFKPSDFGSEVERILFVRGEEPGEIAVAAADYVMVTLGSMTDASSLGDMDTAPILRGKADGGAWPLWETLAKGRPAFGRPRSCDDDITGSKWVSFTATLYDPHLLKLVLDLTGNVPGEGGLITFPDSAWLASIVIPAQPHFIGQPDDVAVFWGYGLSVDRPGDFVPKPMSACTGREIMTEILGHLRVDAEAEDVLATSTCVPCIMPFITSQFMPRSQGDRPISCRAVTQDWL